MIALLLLNLIFSTLSILLLIRIGLKQKNQRVLFSGLVFIVLYLTLTLYIYIKKPDDYFIFQGFPAGLFFGPLLYFTSKTNSRQLFSKFLRNTHTLPFFIGLAIYLFFVASKQIRDQYSNIYLVLLFLLTAVSSLFYAIWNLWFQIKSNLYHSKESLVLVIPSIVTSVFMMSISIYTIPQIIMFYDNFQIVISHLMIVYFLLMLWSLILIFYVIYKRERTIYRFRINEIRNRSCAVVPKYSKMNIGIDKYNDYKLKISGYLETKPYLDPDFNLDTLSNTLKIYKHHCSFFFSSEYGVSFSRYISQLRINDACEILLSNNDISIEEVYMKCGFNSKATFYRSFKDIKNCTPKEFLSTYK